jgi:hypothetical protein
MVPAEKPPEPWSPITNGPINCPFCNGLAGGWHAGFRSLRADGAQRGVFFNQAWNSPPRRIEARTWRTSEILRSVFRNSVVLWIPKWKKKTNYELLPFVFGYLEWATHLFLTVIASTNSLLNQFEKRNSARNQFGKKLKVFYKPGTLMTVASIDCG